jgi:hypothetical protein
MASDGSIAFETSGALYATLFQLFDDGSGADVSCVPTTYRNATDTLTWYLHDVMFRMAWDSTNGSHH